jgi:hypothetical protein
LELKWNKYTKTHPFCQAIQNQWVGFKFNILRSREFFDAGQKYEVVKGLFTTSQTIQAESPHNDQNRTVSALLPAQNDRAIDEEPHRKEPGRSPKSSHPRLVVVSAIRFSHW